MNCLWIVDSKIAVSETFLLQSLSNHREIAEVFALSGAKKPHDALQSVFYSGFAVEKRNFISRLAFRVFRFDFVEWSRKRRARKDLELVVHERLFDYAWIHFGTTAPLVCMVLKSKKIPFFIQVHGADVTARFNNCNYKKEFLLSTESSAGVVCNSEHIRRMLTLAGVKPDKIKIVNNALDMASFVPKDVSKSVNPSLVHFGRLTEKKHPIATLLAFQIVLESYPNARLTFIGDGPLKSELESRIASEELSESVVLLGALTREEAIPIVAEHWIFCQHSVTSSRGDQEGFPNSLAEAALLEMPVVSTFHNGIPENVIDGVTGFLVKEFDYEAMAERILTLIASDELRRSFGKNGRQRIEDFCDPAKRVVKIRGLVEGYVN